MERNVFYLFIKRIPTMSFVVANMRKIIWSRSTSEMSLSSSLARVCREMKAWCFQTNVIWLQCNANNVWVLTIERWILTKKYLPHSKQPHAEVSGIGSTSWTFYDWLDNVTIVAFSGHEMRFGWTFLGLISRLHWSFGERFFVVCPWQLSDNWQNSKNISVKNA